MKNSTKPYGWLMFALSVLACALPAEAGPPTMHQVTLWPPSELTKQIIDKGNPGYFQVIDMNGDGYLDFCRFVGNAGHEYLSCQMGTAVGYLSKNPYGANSPQGVDMGNPPWGILSGSPQRGALYCRYVSVPVKGPPTAASAGADQLELRCLQGVPAPKGGVPKFLSDEVTPCAAGYSAMLLVPDDIRADPYLFCEDTETGVWSAIRTDAGGISWDYSGASVYNTLDGSFTTDLLLRQTTYRVDPNDPKSPTKPTTLVKGQFPVRVSAEYKVNKDGSITSGLYSAGLMNDFGRPTYDYEQDGVLTTVTPKGNGFSISVERSYFDNTKKQNVVTAKFSGTSADGATIQWNGPAPTSSDWQPAAYKLIGRLGKVDDAWANTLKEILAKDAPDLAAKSPAQWTTADMNRIVGVFAGQDSVHDKGMPAATEYVRKIVSIIHVAALTGGPILRPEGFTTQTTSHEIKVKGIRVLQDKTDPGNVIWVADWNECKHNPLEKACSKFIVKN